MSTLPLSFPSLIGYHIAQTLPLPPYAATAYEYILAANGVFLRAQNPHLTALIPVQSFPFTPIRGLCDLQPQITLHHPRLPYDLLTTTLADARTHRNPSGHLIEVLYFFTLEQAETPTHQFSVIKPAQTAGVAHVTHTHTALTPTDAILLELHTHGTMNAFWSGTDNRDEQGFCFYAVVGRLNQEHPTIRLRVGIYGYFWEVPLSTLFDVSEEVVLLYTPTEINSHDDDTDSHP